MAVCEYTRQCQKQSQLSTLWTVLIKAKMSMAVIKEWITMSYSLRSNWTSAWQLCIHNLDDPQQANTSSYPEDGWPPTPSHMSNGQLCCGRAPGRLWSVSTAGKNWTHNRLRSAPDPAMARTQTIFFLLNNVLPQKFSKVTSRAPFTP